MKKKCLAVLALCVASVAQAGWFAPEFNAKVTQVAGGDASWNATQFYTTSAISADGNVLVSREDGLYFKGARISAPGDKVRFHGATLCQKEGLAFYSTSGKNGGVFSVNTLNGKAENLFTFPDYGPEVARYSISPLSVTADCNKLVFDVVAWPGDFGQRTDGFHADYSDRRKAVLFSIIYIAERTQGRWQVRELYKEKRWLSHPDIEPKEGKFLVYTWDGQEDKVTAHILNIASGETKIMHEENLPGRIVHPFWFGDGKHLGAIWSKPSSLKRIVRLNCETDEFREAPVPDNWIPHEAVGKTLKNGNALVILDGKYNTKTSGNAVGPILLLEMDFNNEKTIRMESVMTYGSRFAKTNKTLPSDEGWFPHPNISQDGRFASFTSSNGKSDIGSDVYVISGLPE